MKSIIFALVSFCGLLLAVAPSEAEARCHTNTQLSVNVGGRGYVREVYPSPVYVMDRVPVGRSVRIPCYRPVVVYPEPCCYETVYVPAAPVVRERIYPQSGFGFSVGFFN